MRCLRPLMAGLLGWLSLSVCGAQPGALGSTEEVAEPVDGAGGHEEGEAPEASPPPVRVLDTGGLRAETAALVMSGQEGGTVPMAIISWVTGPRGRPAVVPVVVEAAASGLLEGLEGDTLRVEAMVYALAPDGGIRDYFLKTVEVDLAGAGLAAGLSLRGELELPAGEYSLRVLVRNVDTNEMGLRVRPLVVPGLDASVASLSPPLVARPRSSWIEVDLEPSVALPDAVSAQPLAEPMTSVRLGLLGQELPSPVSSLELEILDRRLERVDRVPVEIEAREATATRDEELVWGRAELPDLASDVYVLRYLLELADRRTVQSESTLLVVVPPGVVSEERRVWADLLRPTRAPEQVAVAEPPRRRRVRIPSAPLEEAFEAAVSSLATGDVRASVAELSAFHRKLVAAKGGDALDALAEIEAKRAKRIGRSDPDALVPIIDLYRRLYVLYRSGEHRDLASHARNRTYELLVEYASRAESSPSIALAADLLADLGSQLQLFGLPRMSEALLERAVHLAPDHPLALLTLAVGLESRAEYGRAEKLLRRLVAGHPDHREARLRLAILDGRLGRTDESRRELTALAAGGDDGEPWIPLLAAQEAARLDLARGDLDSARVHLDEALDRWPDDEKLLLLAALVADYSNDRTKNRELLGRLGLRTGRTAATPRHEYTFWPAERPTQGDRRRLDQAAGERRVALARAIGLTREGGA